MLTTPSSKSYFVDFTSFESIKNSVSLNGSAFVGLNISNSFHGLNGDYYIPAFDDFSVGHSLCIIGWRTINNRLYWIVQNSWGYEWGVNGIGNLDPNLVYALIRVESKYNPYAKSEKGAIGLMQITSNTGKYIAGLMKDKKFSESELYTPEINIKYGCYYMSKLLKDFDNNINCMLAAYNGGEGKVRKWLKSGGNDKSELDASLIPFSETRDYVFRVNKNYKIYKWLYGNKK
jgi:soluble lytic murein transglycosylase